jgi:hypothetical protein
MTIYYVLKYVVYMLYVHIYVIIHNYIYIPYMVYDYDIICSYGIKYYCIIIICIYIKYSYNNYII